MNQLYSQHEFFADLVNKINRAKERVFIQCLYFEQGRLIHPLESALINAVKRRLDVRINVDWISEKYINGELQIFPEFNKQDKIKNQIIKKENRALIDKFKKLGIKIIITNKPSYRQRLLPIAGRNHAKIWIVDNTAWLGGMNVSDSNFDCEDFMVKLETPNMVNALKNQFFLANNKNLKMDYTKNFNGGYELLVDVGRSKKSVIYDKALAIVRKAKKNILFVSQLTPDGNLLKEIVNASKRGIDIYIITSPKNDIVYSTYPFKFIYLVFKYHIRNTNRIHFFHYKSRVHDKLLIIDDKKVLFGSHNLVWSSVLFGTAEVSMLTTDKSLVNQFIDYKKKLLRTMDKQPKQPRGLNMALE